MSDRDFDICVTCWLILKLALFLLGPFLRSLTMVFKTLCIFPESFRPVLRVGFERGGLERGLEVCVLLTTGPSFCDLEISGISWLRPRLVDVVLGSNLGSLFIGVLKGLSDSSQMI